MKSAKLARAAATVGMQPHMFEHFPVKSIS
jgi:hypothetical protein